MLECASLKDNWLPFVLLHSIFDDYYFNFILKFTKVSVNFLITYKWYVNYINYLIIHLTNFILITKL